MRCHLGEPDENDPRHYDHGDPAVDSIWRGRLNRKRHAKSVLICQEIVPEWRNIERAARLAEDGHDEDAESQRKIAGYHG